MLDQHRSHRRRQRRLALGHRPYTREDLGRRRCLQQIAGRASTDRGEDLLVRLVRGQHQHPPQPLGDQLRGRVDPVEHGHPQVQEDDVGHKPPGLGQGLCPVRRLPDNLEVLGVGEDAHDPGPDDGVVVDHEHADHETPSRS